MKAQIKDRLKRIARIIIAGVGYITILTAAIVVAKIMVSYTVFIWELIP